MDKISRVDAAHSILVGRGDAVHKVCSNDSSSSSDEDDSST